MTFVNIMEVDSNDLINVIYTEILDKKVYSFCRTLNILGNMILRKRFQNLCKSCFLTNIV